MANETESLKMNIRARKSVEELFEFVPDIIKFNKVNEEVFWSRLAEQAAAKVGMVLTADNPTMAMSEKDACNFEKEQVPYGKHVGKKVGAVPPTYWVAFTESEFAKRLARYLRSPRFRNRQ